MSESTITMTEEHLSDYKGRSVCFYHPNARGTGSAFRIEPRVNRHDADRYNCFFIELAGQRTTAGRERGPGGHATFDWDKKITVKLGFLDICEMLMVLEGRVPHMGGDRKGLYHASKQGNTLISLTRDAERGTYYLSLSRKRNGDANAQRIGIGLTEAEATGLRCLLQTGLFFVTFSSALKSRWASPEKKAADVRVA